MGKRALYWLPVGEEDIGAGGQPPGTSTSPVPPTARRHARPSGKHALFSSATPAGDEEIASIDPGDPLPPRGMLVVACSSCGSVSRVGVLEFCLLQLPFGAWLPRRVFDRWMTCPACRRRTWTSVTLSR